MSRTSLSVSRFAVIAGMILIVAVVILLIVIIADVQSNPAGESVEVYADPPQDI